MDETHEALLDTILRLEMEHAYEKFGDFHSPHELYGVLHEEHEEYWDSVKANEEDLYELLQVVGVAYRYIKQKVEENPQHLFDIEHSQEERWCHG